MRALLWQARRLRRYINVPTVLALVLLLASAVVYEEQVLPGRAEWATLADEVARIRTPAKDVSTLETPLSPDEQLVAFYAFFPTNTVQSDVLDRLFAAAAKENLAVPQGDYQWSKEHLGALIRYGIALPLKGSYPGLRRFMAQALKENPALSLDAVSFGRPTVTDIGVDAQVHFTLYLRSETP